MIQLDFDGSDAAEALGKEPTKVGYSSHEGAERADWGDDKLQLSTARILSSTRPRAATRNKFGDALYLGSTAEAGVGCDNTQGPHDELRPVVKTIPRTPAEARRSAL
jgi:hypothetical protein